MEQKLTWKTTAQVIISSIPGPMKECHTGSVVLALTRLQQLSHQMQEACKFLHCTIPWSMSCTHSLSDQTLMALEPPLTTTAKQHGKKEIIND